MGTSADLAVRHRGQTYYQHTSYDGHIPNVLSQLCATIAAMGLDALRQNMDKQAKPPVWDPESDHDEIMLDRNAMGTAYLLACQARGNDPFNLQYAIDYEYGNPDFSHGGAIALLAPTVQWDVGFCDSIEQATFILDLDKNVLVVPAWNDQVTGSYEDASMKTLFTVDLNRIEGLDPRAVAQEFSETDFDDEASDDERHKIMETAIQKVEAGLVEFPPSYEHNAHARFDSDDGQDQEPSIHSLRGYLNHYLYFQSAVNFLRAAGRSFPLLAQKNTMMAALHPATDPEDSQQELFVDLRECSDPRVEHLVNTLFSKLARTCGMLYKSVGPHREQVVSMNSTSASSGFGSGSQDWDKDAIHETAMALLTVDESDAKLDACLAGGKIEEINSHFIHAVLDFNAQRWAKIQDAGIDGIMTVAQMRGKHYLEVAVDLAKIIEQAWPNSTADRFNLLSPGQRSEFLENLDPLSRFSLVSMLASAQKDEGIDAAKQSKGFRP